MKLRLPLLLLSAVLATYSSQGTNVFAAETFTTVIPSDGALTLGAGDKCIFVGSGDINNPIVDETVITVNAAGGTAGLEVTEKNIWSVLNGTLKGTGNLEKLGEGTLRLGNLTGVDLKGTFTVSSGVLELTGLVDQEALKTTPFSIGSSVTVKDGAELFFNLPKNLEYTLTSDVVMQGGSTFHIREAKPILNGKFTVDAASKKVQVKIDWDKTMTLKGGLAGQGTLEILSGYGEWGGNWGGKKSFIIDCSGSEFNGNINVLTDGNSNGDMYLVLKKDDSATNAAISLVGSASNKRWSVLQLDAKNATIKELNGNAMTQILVGGSGATLTIKNGGVFAGSVADGLSFVIQGGEFTLGSANGVTMSGTISGAGGLKVSGQNILIAKSVFSYTGKTTVENGGIFSMSTGSSLSSSSLEMNGGLFILGNGQGSVFGSITLSTGGGDSILVVGEKSSLNAGTITGGGLLVVAGTDSITGTLGAGSSLDNILFESGGKLYKAVSADGKLSKGEEEAKADLDSIVYSPAAGSEIKVESPLPLDKTKLIQAGKGTIVLNTDVSGYTGQYVLSSGGTLQFTATSKEVKGTSLLMNGSTLEYKVDSGDLKVSGAFSGDGNIVKSGNGTAIFNNFTGAYASGDVTIKSGILRVEAVNGSTLFGSAGSSGTITVGENATFRMESGSDLVVNKNVVLQNNSVVYNNDAGNLKFNGTMTINGHASIKIECDKQMTIGGALIGDADSVLSVASTNLTPWGGARMVTLNAESNDFKGRLSVESTTTWPVTLRLNHEKAAVNAVVGMIGYTGKNAILKLAQENTQISGLDGNEYSEIQFDGRSTGTLIIGNGGTYGGTLADGLTLSITQGSLFLGAGSGRTINNVLSGNGGMSVGAGNSLTYGGVATYTGTTAIYDKATLVLGAGASLSAESGLVISGGQLVVETGNEQTFKGLSLSEDTFSSIALKGDGTALNVGIVSGGGSVAINGATAIKGTASEDQLWRIMFMNGSQYNNATLSGDSIVIGTEFADLAPDSNDGKKNFIFRNNADLTMINPAGTQFTIGNLAIAGSGKTLTLGAGGLKINGNLFYENGDQETTAISGGSLEIVRLQKDGTGELVFNSAVDAGTVISSGSLVFNSDANIGSITASGVLTFAGNALVSDGLAGAAEVNVKGNGKKVTLAETLSNFTGSFKISDGGILELSCSSPEFTWDVALSNGGTLSLGIASGEVKWNQPVIHGDGNIWKTGAGTLVVNGDYAKDLTSGDITVEAGQIRVDVGNDSTVFGAGTGTVSVKNGAILQFYNGNNLIVDKNISLQNGGKIEFVWTGTIDVKGLLEVVGSGKIDCWYQNTNYVFSGGLKGDNESVLNFISAASAWDGGRVFTLKGTGELFDGQINVTSPSNSDNRKVVLNLQHEKAAYNALLNLDGNSRNRAEVLIGTTETAVRELTGNQYSWLGLMEGTSSATLIIREGGEYAGELDGNLRLSISEGSLILGRSDGQTIGNAISGNGGVTVGNGKSLTYSGQGTYTGYTIIEKSATLTLNASSGVISSSSTLVLNDGSRLIINGGTSQTFNGVQLADGSDSSLSVGSGFNLTLGAITGTEGKVDGSLMISGISEFTGSIDADSVGLLYFYDGTSYYNAQLGTGDKAGKIVRGGEFGELTASSNDANQRFLFKNSADLVMDNGAGNLYTIGGLLASGTGKTLTLGAGGLKIKNSLTYKNDSGQTMTINGGPLEVRSLSKDGDGGMAINSALTVSVISTKGTLSLGGGGSVSEKLTGSGVINFNGTGQKLFSVNGEMNNFAGTLNIATDNTVALNVASTGALVLQGAGNFTINGGLASAAVAAEKSMFTGAITVKSGQLTLTGRTSTDPAGRYTFDEKTYNSPSSLHVEKEGVLMIDQTALTGTPVETVDDKEEANYMKPWDARTIRNLTGDGTLVLKTVGGGVEGGGAGALGSYVYVGEAGFTGTIEVLQGALSFRNCDLGQAKVKLDGGAFSSGVEWGGGRDIDRVFTNDFEIGANGAVMRLYGGEKLTLNGKLTGSGTIRYADGGTLTFGGDMSGYTGNFESNIFENEKVVFNSARTSMGTFSLLKGKAEFNGDSTSLKGLVYSWSAGGDNPFSNLTFNSGELILGNGGITTTLDAFTMTFGKDVVLKASDSWSTAKNVSLDLSKTKGISVNTGAYNVDLQGNLILGEGADHRNLTKEGSGTLTLHSELNLAGDIALKGGVLDYMAGNLGGRSLRFENNAVLRLSRTQDLTATVSGTGTMELLSGVALNVKGALRGGFVLDMKGSNTLNFTESSTGAMGTAGLILRGAGNVISFKEGTNLALEMGLLDMKAGATLNVTNYNSTINNYISFNGITAWQLLDGITLNDGKAAMADTRGHLIEYQANVVIGSLVKSGTQENGSGYEYKSSSQYYGALDGAVVDFSQPFTFSSGASTYGFTTQDDAHSGMRAGSFTVSSQMTDGSSSRVVSVLGQAGATDRTVTLTHTGNSFTGDVTVTNAVLKADAKDPASIGNAPVTILGRGNTVYLLENATLDLATGAGSYVYGNNFTLNGSNALIRQTEGEHTLTGTITVAGSGNRVIDNTLASGALTLTGSLVSRGENTLMLNTKASDDSRIVLSLSGNATVNRLEVNGHVEQARNGMNVVNGMVLGTNASYLLSSGSLAVGGELRVSGGLEKVISFGNGTSLAVLGDSLAIGQNVKLAFAQEQSVMTLDTGAGVMSFKGTLGSATADNALVKKGVGVLELYQNNISTPAAIRVEQGTLSLKEGARLSATGDFALLNGSTLNLDRGSSLSLSPSRTFTFNGSVTGNGGSISGVDKLAFNNGTRYAASMSGQAWDVVFKSGSSFSGGLLKHAGDIVFERGSHMVFDTTLPVSDNSIGISTTGTHTVRFNGTTVSGSSATQEIDWDATQSYVFTLVKSMKELLGADGQMLTQDNLNQSVSVGGDGWGAFLQGDLGLSSDSKELQVTVTRNGSAMSTYAQTANQAAVAGALDEAMNSFSTLGLRGTELGDVIQYFNKMGKNIATDAPEALGMVGGLSNYQALAGQRTDMMRHMEAVRQRANAGKGLAGISNIPDNSFWAEGTQGYTRMDGTDNSTPGYTAQSWGAAIGMDYLSAPAYSLGVAFAYSSLKVDSNQYAGQTKSDNYYVDLYGRWESGNWNGVVVLSGGTASVDVKRTMTMGSDSYHGTGSTDGTQILGMAEVAYNWQWEEEGPVLQPYLGMAVGQSKLDGYTESGLGNASLMLDEQKQTVAQASLGVRLFKQNIDREMQYEESRWELRAGLVEEFGDTDFVTRSSFIGLPGYTMQTRSEDIGKTGLQIGAGFSKALDESWSVFGDVNGEFRSGQKSMNSTLGLRCTF